MNETTPKVTVLVPALNEEASIREVVDRLLALDPPVEVIVIDDGSTDQTPAILSDFGSRIQVITNPEKHGKGAAIRKALPHASGEVVVVQDADLEYAPEQIWSLASKIVEGKSTAVYGTRFSKGMPSGMALPNKVVNRMLAWSANILFGQRITDEATCYKAIRTDLLRDMRLECIGFEFCPEVTAKLSRMGQKIDEVPITYQPRSHAEGKKIRWTDAPIAFWTLLKYRFWTL